jgi:hypothetical protein
MLVCFFHTAHFSVTFGTYSGGLTERYEVGGSGTNYAMSAATVHLAVDTSTGNQTCVATDSARSGGAQVVLKDAA